MTDKRNYHRFKIWFPVTLVIGTRQVWAICRDASSGGFLLSVESPLDVGTKLELEARFKVSPRARSERSIKGKVIRTEASVGELMQAFPYRAAVEFSKPVHDLLDDLARFSDTLVW
jgi:hypothetical protein